MSLLEKISTTEKKELVKTWLLLLKSGEPVNDTFDTMAKQTNSPYLKKTLEEVKERTQKGTSIYRVFEDDPKFEKIFSSFVRSGEESGTLEESLNNLTDWLSRKERLEKEISSATLYPKIIFSFAILLGGGLTYFVLPRLTPIFDALNVELPLISRILLSFSNFIQDYGLHVIVGLVAFVIFLYLLRKITIVKEALDRWILKVPIIGDLVQLYYLTIIFQIISTLFGSGLNILKILDITIASVSNSAYKKSLLEAKEKVKKGNSFSSALSKYPNLYPSLYINIITTGEKTGSFTESFEHIADHSATSIKEKSEKIPVILEPVVLIIVGLFVGFITAAILLPVYQVTQGLY